MKKVSIILILIIALISCKKESILDSTFNCDTEKISDSKRISDFKKNFSIVIPTNYKTDLYYNSFQSEIFTADTTKQLSNSFILKVSNNSGELIYDGKFFKKIDSVSKKINQELVISQIENFNEHEMYWNVFKSVKKGLTYHQFNSYIKTSNNSYINSSVEIYGDININERLCEAVNLLKTIDFKFI